MLLTPPTDAALRGLLKLKLEDYRKRKTDPAQIWMQKNMTQQRSHNLFPAFRDAFYKTEILEGVLSTFPDQILDTEQVKDKIQAELEVHADKSAFENAGAIIAEYLNGSHGITL